MCSATRVHTVVASGFERGLCGALHYDGLIPIRNCPGTARTCNTNMFYVDIVSCGSSISEYSTITARHAADAVGANIRPQHRRRPAEESRCKCKRRLQLLLLSHTLRIENQRICSAVCDYLSCSLWLHYLPLHVFQALESKLASCRNFVNSQPRHSKPGSVSSPSHSPRSVRRCLDAWVTWWMGLALL